MLEQVKDVHRRAGAGASTNEWAHEWLPRHAARDAFRFLAALDEEGAVAGFAYGYTGGRGQWWTDRVSAALDEDLRARWLVPPHFEVVELHVRPEGQRRGLGSRLLDALLDGLPHRQALLSTQVDNAKARPFYEKHGWEVVVPELSFGPGYAPFCVYGKRLR
ncbi:MAG TPA: GNAT family N-acetyltransferase [Gaiellaceae bacterium]|nr:GNAT family N-acetyltransferase [Gaiellaceae bacterium]